MATFKITELTGEAYNEALRQTASLKNSAGYQYKIGRDDYEIEVWSEDNDLQYDEEGNLL